MKKRIRVPDLLEMKKRGERITMLTAYDAAMAGLLERASIDILLVGDSVGMVLLGYRTTLPVTLDAIVYHTAAVTRGAHRALVVADMPFLSYEVSVEETVRNAGRLIQEGGAAAVKLEGGSPHLETVRRLTGIGIPVMGHLGLTPQSYHALGGFRPQGRTEESAEKLLAEALRLEQAGVFSLVLECIPFDLAGKVSESLKIPTIGIGAGPHCDGQVLVTNDALGLFEGGVPSFVKRYARLAETIVEAAQAYASDVRSGAFPRESKGPPGEKKEKPV